MSREEAHPWAQQLVAQWGRPGRQGSACTHCLSASSPESCLGTGTEQLLKEICHLLYSSCHESPTLPFKPRLITAQRDIYHLYLLGSYINTAGS